ncbi:MAG: hypothetical protein QOJ62_1720 [Actinomycetota bacterium]|nr:hypothetical protein [Actinomycetota bacterium]
MIAMTDHELGDDQRAPSNGGHDAERPEASGGGEVPAALPNHPADITPGFGLAGQPFGLDILGNGPIEPTRRRAMPVLVSAVAVVAVIAGGVTYVGFRAASGKGGQPDTWAPANSIAFAKFDLDPSSAQQTAAWQFEQKFPSAPHVSKAGDLKDALLGAAFKKQAGDTTDFAADVKPWLGDQVAVAVFTDGLMKPVTVEILQVTDAAKAKAGLAKISKDNAAGSTGRPPSGYTVEGGYAIIGETQSIVDDAVAAARKSNIGDNATYGSDIATLKGDRIATGWVDLTAVMKLTTAAQGQLATGGMLLPGGLGGIAGAGAGGTGLKGRMVAGLRVEANAVELEGRQIGADLTAYKNGKAGAMLGELPSGTVFGLAESGLGDIAKQSLAALEKSPQVGGGLLQQITALNNVNGLNLPTDAYNLLGGEFAIGVDDVPAVGGSASTLKVTAISEPVDAAKGLETAQKLAVLASLGGFPVTASASGSQVVITNDKAASGKLGSDADFKVAMAGMPDQTSAAYYVNLSSFWNSEIGSGVSADMQHLSGVGMYQGISGADVVFSIRLTVK